MWGAVVRGLVDDAHNGVAFGMAEGVIPQAIVVFGHGIAFGAAGMVAVSDEASNDAGGLMPHRCAIAIQGVKEHVLAFAGRDNKGAAVTEGVKLPIISVVVLTQEVELGKYR